MRSLDKILVLHTTSDFDSYAELIQNRAFQGSDLHPSTLDPWTAMGSAEIALDDSSSPLSSALPTSVQVTASADGTVGIKNPGWWGSKSHGFLLARASAQELEHNPEGMVIH